MNQDNFTVTGQVVDHKTNQGIAELHIEAWDKDLIFHDLVGSADTDRHGRFRISFTRRYFSEIFFDRRPDLFFKIFRNGSLIRSTEDSVLWNLEQGDEEVIIEVDLSVAEAPNKFVVKGIVRDEFGTPVAGAIVKVVDKDLRHEEPLGKETTTGQDGSYEITYTPQQFYRAEKKSADLIVRVYDRENPELVLAASSIQFNAPEIATVDLRVDTGISEFDRLLNDLAPLLKIDNVALTELTEDDIAFLAGETGFKKEWLQILADAARIADEAALDIDLAGNDVIALFYGLGRKGRQLALSELLSEDFYMLRRILESALDENTIPSYLSDELDVFFAELNRLASEAGIEKPVSHIAVQQEHLQRLGEFIGLDSIKISTLINRVVSFSGISDITLGALVEEGGLEDQEAKEIGLIVSLYQLCDKNEALAQEMKIRIFPQLPQGNVGHVKDLVVFTRSDWLNILTQTETTPPDDLTMEEYAGILSKKIEKLYPSDTLLARLIQAEGTENLTDTIKKSTHDLEKLAATYKGLKLDEIIGNPELSADEKAVQVNERVGLLARFQSQNSEAEVLTLDYTAQSEEVAALDFSGFNAEEQRMVLSCFKAYQRVYAVSEDVETCRTLMSAGYDSANRIADDSEEDFRIRSGLSADCSHDIYSASKETASASASGVASLADVARGGYGWIDLSNQCEEIDDYLKQIEGFADLFGSLDYCRCRHCQSILSPAAYFVDLMSFVEDRVTGPNFSGELQNHVLNLKTRRKDLWELPLTCENTHGLTPYLDIINEVLENYIYISEHNEGSDELPDRSEIEQFVYKEKIGQFDIHDHQLIIHSFKQPKLLPLQKLETYLSHFEVNRGEIAKLLEKGSTVIAATVLSLSHHECYLITAQNTDHTFNRRLYGIYFTINSETGLIDEFDAQELLSPMQLSRSELGDLISTEYVQPGSHKTIWIQGEKQDINESVQEDIEKIYGLTLSSLDRMHRFTRLWRQLSWNISELDLVLSHLEDEGLSLGIENTTLSHIVTLLALQKRFPISVEELCALWSLIPKTPVAGQDISLFDRLFNLPQFVSHDGKYPKKSRSFTHPAFGQEGEEQSRDLHRLLAGLQVNEEDLYHLIVHLSTSLDYDTACPGHETGFCLKKENLALLYRHARLARLLKLTIPELFQLIGQILPPESTAVMGLDSLNLVLQYHEWWRSTDYSLDEITRLLTPTGTAESLAGAAEIAARLLEEVHRDGALTFADTVFAYLENVTEEQSRSIIAANPELIYQEGTLYWLTDKINDEALVIPNDVDVTEEDIRTLLLSYHPREILPLYLARHLDCEVDKTKVFITMAMADPALSWQVLFSSLHEVEVPDTDAPLTMLVEKLQRLSLLFKGKSFDAPALESIREHGHDIFSIDDFTEPGIVGIQKISLYEDFLSDIDEPASMDDLNHVLVHFSDKSFTDQQTLARLLQTEAGLITTIIAQLPPLSSPLHDFEKIRSCVAMARRLGVGGDALGLIVSETYDELDQAQNAVFGAFRARYDNEEEWNEKITPFEETIRTFKRDVLTDYLVHSPEHAWCATDKDLYYYFLLDVELEGCARTSKVVAAISSLHLYVHRVLMNLEQSEDGQIQVKPVQPDEFFNEWQWRKNYRVWEANRKVFLYPENWIEPELRDNKTPLFEDLESELLQQEINEQTVLDAYAKYMGNFEELAHLKIAGSYHEKDEESKTDTLHLFGVTSDEPPIYYYRGIENSHYGETEPDRGIVWHPWRKVEVQIPVSKVSPIVFRGRLHVFWVEITTRPKNDVKGGNSQFVGYQHKMSLKYTKLRLDGTWTTPQRISLYGVAPFDMGDGIIEDPLLEPADYLPALQHLPDWFEYFNTINDLSKTPKYDDQKHTEPKDGYTLTGYRWDQVYPDVYKHENKVEYLTITGRDFELIDAHIDFYDRIIKDGADKLTLYDYNNSSSQENRWLQVEKLLHTCINNDQRKLYDFFAGRLFYEYYAFASILIDIERSQFIQNKYNDDELSNNIDDMLGENKNEIADIEKNSLLSVINGSIEDIIIDSNGDLLILQSLPRGSSTHLLKRLGTTLSGKVARTLLTRGVDGLLDIDTQKNELIEKDSPINKTGEYIDDSYITKAIDAGHPDFKGAFGTYYREIFFHIPFLIANHLNSQQQFREARKWYHYIFNPTANEESESSESGTSPFPENQTSNKNDRVWRYIEFRNLTIEKLRELLTDSTTIETYKKNPFNPHAIARLRLTAYQKTIVMKYIDNLLDWGDDLFAQDTMESINEAALLYILASDILGERPAELGECSEIPESSRTYESIREVMDTGSEFLIEMESYPIFEGRPNFASPANSVTYTLDLATVTHATEDAYAGIATASFTENDAASVKYSAHAHMSASKQKNSAAKFSSDVGLSMQMDWNQANMLETQYSPGEWVKFVKHMPVFCIPENKELKQYWDRVEDRLYKIRNCLNISGVRRELSLFAPEIDPGLLVRTEAAGLSVEDVLNAISGNLPPYRFSYVIEKAKSYAATLQGFGSALLSALEKKDVEELTLLRAVHEQNIMKMTRQAKQWEIDAADQNLEGLIRRKETIEQRRDYYQGLVDEGLTSWEHIQQGAQIGVIAAEISSQVLTIAANIASGIPQVGSPFAITYGGKQLSSAFHYAGLALKTSAAANQHIASAAGIEAGHQRREQNWRFQLDQAILEFKELDKQIKAAEIHKDLTVRSLEIHEKSLDQLDEVYEFYGDKFSSLGLYTWLSTTLQRLYREVYNSAYSMAKLAEQTYRFERSDDTGELLGSSPWEASRAGLLAGERLLIDLQNLERKYIETNYRSLEINQAFSLTQIAPDALLTLKETGSCEFSINELFFDLYYPGQYRRKIKAVRLTIPCVTGPYTNVSATLTLKDSYMRVEPVTGSDALKPVPLTRALSIAASSAQNDAGVFELNFRDERYMPFEGAGAVSSWKLALPTSFRQFDYETISDVLVHISYTAEEDGLFREQIEKLNAETEGTLLNSLTKNALLRIFSLRHDFSNEYHRLTHNSTGSAVTITLTDAHFPLFLKGKKLKVDKTELFLKVPVGQNVNGFSIKFNEAFCNTFSVNEETGSLLSCNLESVFSGGILGEHTITIENTGDLASDTGIDPDKLEDILFYIAYKI